ncbi:MAG: hypothetical protein RQ952_02470 [Thermoproteota archaeon]|jgi:hypothetical protein|nr:hypothetical protein [Thermoproteota archaeon]
MGKRVEKRRATLYEKMKKALHLILIQRRSIPGATGYELKKFIGRKYLYIIKLLNSELDSFGLMVKIVLPQDIKDPKNPSEDDYLRAHYYIVSKEPILGLNMKGNFNIEELACLSACIVQILARSNNANFNELKELLESKVGKIKASRYIEKFRKLGYLEINNEGIVKLGWRTMAEINIENLLKFLAIYKI